MHYRGEALIYSPKISAFARSARALVPYLEKLARSHGELVDRTEISGQHAAETIVALEPSQISPMLEISAHAFSGFTPVSGWQPEEGPVPEAFLPRFHWATGPETALVIVADTSGSAEVQAQVLSYAEQQEATVFLNDVELSKFAFPRVNQKENWTIPLPLAAGENRLVIRHSTWIESAADPRKLALIFLSLRVVKH